MAEGSFKILLFSAVSAALWLISATFFRIASKGDRKATQAH
jgi:hypothetical protein